MRLPLATELKTRPGDNTKDARLKNSYAEVRGEQTVVRKRTGATDLGLMNSVGYAQLIACWDATLSVIGDSLLLHMPTQDYMYNWSNATQWSASVTYTSSSWVWYNGQLWHWVSGTVGVAPTSPAWENYESITYSADKIYNIGNRVRVNGVSYYCYANSTIGIPVSNTNIWGTTAPPATRYYGTGVGYDQLGDPNYGSPSPSCATKTAVCVAWYAMRYRVSCAREGFPQFCWLQNDFYVGGSIGYFRGRCTIGSSYTCATSVDAGYGASVNIIQTA